MTVSGSGGMVVVVSLSGNDVVASLVGDGTLLGVIGSLSGDVTLLGVIGSLSGDGTLLGVIVVGGGFSEPVDLVAIIVGSLLMVVVVGTLVAS